MSKKKVSISERIRRKVLGTPGITAAEVSKALDIPANRVHVIMWQMRKQGLLPPSTYRKRDAEPTQAQAQAQAQPKKENWRTLKVVASSVPIEAATSQPAVDIVNQPPHYKVGGIETIDFIEAKLTPEEFRGYLKGNILKYGSRVGHKGEPAIDAGKLAWYADRYARTVQKAA